MLSTCSGRRMLPTTKALANGQKHIEMKSSTIIVLKSSCILAVELLAFLCRLGRHGHRVMPMMRPEERSGRPAEQRADDEADIEVYDTCRYGQQYGRLPGGSFRAEGENPNP